MEIKCYECGNVINRDVYKNGILVEEYKNIHGTYCKCGNFIRPLKKTFSNEDKEMKMEILKEDMREKLRKKLKGEE